jgi:predicted membrane protein
VNADSRERARSGASLAVGVFIIAIGLLFFLGNLGILDPHRLLRFWPVIFIAVGVQKILQPDARVGRGTAYVWLGVGGWLLLSQLDLIHLRFHDIWPLLFIFVGGRLLWRQFRTDPAGAGTFPADANSFVSSLAIMGGFDRTNTSTDFKGGDLTTFMGGGKIDLSQARIAQSPAVIDIFVMWGGIEIIVPDDWVVTIQLVPIMGGYEDKTRPPADAVQRLVITGLALMGGIGVKPISAVGR